MSESRRIRPTGMPAATQKLAQSGSVYTGAAMNLLPSPACRLKGQDCVTGGNGENREEEEGFSSVVSVDSCSNSFPHSAVVLGVSASLREDPAAPLEKRRPLRRHQPAVLAGLSCRSRRVSEQPWMSRHLRHICFLHLRHLHIDKPADRRRFRRPSRNTLC